MGKTKDQGPKGRCQNRAWEVLINDYDLKTPLKETFQKLLSLEHGIYKGFATPHTKDGKTHVHFGLILRDKPRTLTWKQVPAYFRAAHPNTCQSKLKDESRDFDKKLQTYFNYTQDVEKHEGEIIHESYLYRWKPKSPDELRQECPQDFLEDLIFSDLTVDQLDEHIDGENTIWVQKTRSYALRNYEKLEKMIEKLQDIRDKRKLAAEYKKDAEGYRPFQEGLSQELDNQDDRNIHCHFDPGLTGKNHFVDCESKRTDTLILQSAETKRIAYAWDPKKHRRIIFDIPKNKMHYVNTSVIEKLKNGTLFSEMHHPKMKKSSFKPKILILGNEKIDRDSWTEDRATYSSTNRENFEYQRE